MEIQRTVVGIAVGSSPDGETIIAACDDGSVWQLENVLQWAEIAPIPGTQRSRDLPQDLAKAGLIR